MPIILLILYFQLYQNNNILLIQVNPWIRKDTNKISNLDILDTKCNFKKLELEGIDLNDDWSKLSKLKNLETLILKDSYIDFKNFIMQFFHLKIK